MPGTSASISPVERLRELGGIATRGTLLRTCDRAVLDRAVASGDVVRIARGRYASAEFDEGKVAAARVGGVLCLTSAALAHGWAVKTVPDRPHVMVSRGRRVDREDQSCSVHLGELDSTEVDDGVTTIEVTLSRGAGLVARQDLVDERLAIAIEADAFEWRAGRAQLSADARRYNLMVVNGWWVLRFAYEHVMLQPQHVRDVRDVLVAMVSLAARMNDRLQQVVSAA